MKDKISATLSPSWKVSVGSGEIWNGLDQCGQIPAGSTEVWLMQNTDTFYNTKKKRVLGQLDALYSHRTMIKDDKTI